MNLSLSKQGILLLALWIIGCTGKQTTEKVHNNRFSNAPTDTFELIYTKHAKCRMDCREVSKSEVIEIIAGNRINTQKSDYNDKPCPTIAYEGRSSDGQLLRVVVADCEPKDKVVTVIDLETDYKCDCY